MLGPDECTLVLDDTLSSGTCGLGSLENNATNRSPEFPEKEGTIHHVWACRLAMRQILITRRNGVQHMHLEDHHTPVKPEIRILWVLVMWYRKLLRSVVVF